MTITQKRDAYVALCAAALAGGLQQGCRDDMDGGWWYTPEKIAGRAADIAVSVIKIMEASGL
jgi:hypothetical protein